MKKHIFFSCLTIASCWFIVYYYNKTDLPYNGYSSIYFKDGISKRDFLPAKHCGLTVAPVNKNGDAQYKASFSSNEYMRTINIKYDSDTNRLSYDLEERISIGKPLYNKKLDIHIKTLDGKSEIGNIAYEVSNNSRVEVLHNWVLDANFYGETMSIHSVYRGEYTSCESSNLNTLCEGLIPKNWYKDSGTYCYSVGWEDAKPVIKDSIAISASENCQDGQIQISKVSTLSKSHLDTAMYWINQYNTFETVSSYGLAGANETLR